jgi:hypothetical protein
MARLTLRTAFFDEARGGRGDLQRDSDALGGAVPGEPVSDFPGAPTPIS